MIGKELVKKIENEKKIKIEAKRPRKKKKEKKKNQERKSKKENQGKENQGKENRGRKNQGRKNQGRKNQGKENRGRKNHGTKNQRKKIGTGIRKRKKRRKRTVKFQPELRRESGMTVIAIVKIQKIKLRNNVINLVHM